MQKRTFAIEVKNLHEFDEDFFTFEGLASAFNRIDQVGHKILKGAFKKSILNLEAKAKPIPNTEFKRLLPVLWQHQESNTIGSFIEVKETSQGLFVKGILPRDDTFVSGRVIPQMKAGSVSDMSIGFLVGESNFVDGVRELEEIKLLEISLVTIPMDDRAVVTEFKSSSHIQDLPLAERDTPWDMKGAVERVKEFTGSKDAPSATYRNAFLFFDEEKSGDFSEYKLPIADVIEGKLFVIPRAIFAATVSLRGGGGDLNIPSDRKDNVISRITQEYKRMDLQSPFENNYLLGKSEVLGLSTRELERILLAHNVCSKEGAKSIASKYKGANRDDCSNTPERDASAPSGFGDFAKALINLKTSLKD